MVADVCPPVDALMQHMTFKATRFALSAKRYGLQSEDQNQGIAVRWELSAFVRQGDAQVDSSRSLI